MFRELRQRAKDIPVVGPAMHNLYLKTFKNEEEEITIPSGPLAGKTWIRFMRTFNPDYISGSYEMPIQQALERHLKKGMVFYDVGANAGFFSVLASGMVGRSGAVISFEPHPITAQQCEAQIRANNMDNVTVVAAAVCDKVGFDQFSDDECSVMTSLAGAAAASRKVTVRTTTLDHEITQHPVPDLLKIDVEGAEIDALRGAVSLLTKRRPIFLVEIHSDELAVQYDSLMEGRGYKTFSLDDEKPIRVSESKDRFVISKPA